MRVQTECPGEEVDLPFRLGESEMRHQDRSRVLWDWDWRVAVLARTDDTCTTKLQSSPLNKKTVSVRQYQNICSWVPDGNSTPRETARLTVGRKIPSTYRTLDQLWRLLDYLNI
jgi:hypothetical protein